MSKMCLVSKCSIPHSSFSKELYTEVSDNLKIMSEEEFEANPEEYKKVLFAVYIRTDKDNLVLTMNKDRFASVFHIPDFVVSGGVYPNLLYDSSIACGSEFVNSAFTFSSEEALVRFGGKSTCFPVGAVETAYKYIIVCNIIISSELLIDSEINLSSGFYFHPIETLKVKDSLQKEISKSLVLVKKAGETNE